MLALKTYNFIFALLNASLLLLSENIQFSQAWSGGAPDRTCFQLLPSPRAHGPPDPSPSPYAIEPDNDLTFATKENIHVKIVSSEHPFYRGLLLQARIINKDGSYNLPVWQGVDPKATEESVFNTKGLIAKSLTGYWIPDANVTQLIKCRDNFTKEASQRSNRIDKSVILAGGDTLTHMTGEDKPVNISYNWYPSHLENGTKIQFFATIIFTRRQYWVGVKSKPLTYVGDRFIMEEI